MYNLESVPFELFTNVLRELKQQLRNGETSNALDLIDSFGPEQLASKTALVSNLVDHNLLSLEKEVVVLGSWYGSLLVPLLAPLCSKITCIDLDPRAIQVCRNRLFPHEPKLVCITGDAINILPKLELKRVGCVINTSCEHMADMKFSNVWDRLRPGTGFAFQSNDFLGVAGHTNCVSSISQFKNQLPADLTFLVEKNLADARGTRFLLVGTTN